MSEQAAPEVRWTVTRRDAGTWRTVQNFEDGLLPEDRFHTYRYKAVFTAIQALMDGADGVEIHRHPPLSSKTTT